MSWGVTYSSLWLLLLLLWLDLWRLRLDFAGTSQRSVDLAHVVWLLRGCRLRVAASGRLCQSQNLDMIKITSFNFTVMKELNGF